MPLEFDSLETVLTQPDMHEAFRKHLVSEYSTENIEFFDAVTSFKAAALDGSASEEELREQAKQIFATYVDSSGEVRPGEEMEHNKQVNLKATNYDPIKAGVDNISTKSRADMATMFDGGQKEITGLMQSDSFARFKSSEGFKATQAKLNDSVKPEEAKIAQLEAKLDKLKTSKFEQFKAFFKGGTEKVKQDIADQIDLAKMQIIQKVDPAGFAQIQKQNQKSIESLAAEREILAPSVSEHDAAIDAVKLANLKEGIMGSDMSKSELAEVRRERSNAIDTVLQTEGVVLAHKGLDDEVSGLKKNVSVREALGKKTEAPVVGEGPRARIK